MAINLKSPEASAAPVAAPTAGTKAAAPTTTATTTPAPEAAPAAPVKAKKAKAMEAATVAGLPIFAKRIEDLILYENNPRKNDNAVPKMVQQIKEFGFVVPVLVRGDHLVDGHLRIKAAKAIGMIAVPAVDVSNLSEAQVKALRISINRSAEWAEWDTVKLDLEFKGLMAAGVDLNLTGFDMVDVAKIAQDAMKSTLPPVTPPPKTQSADAGTPADPAHVSLSFTMTADARDAVMAKLKDHQKLHGLGNPSQALVHILKSL